MERLRPAVPASLYPLAYPAYDEDPVRAPALRVTHSDGSTTTRLRVADVQVAGPATEILLVDPDLARSRSGSASGPRTTACCASGSAITNGQPVRSRSSRSPQPRRCSPPARRT